MEYIKLQIKIKHYNCIQLPFFFKSLLSYTLGRIYGKPPPSLELLRGGRYASFVHAGGLSCFSYFELSACIEEAITEKEISRKVEATEHNEFLQEKVKTNTWLMTINQ